MTSTKLASEGLQKVGWGFKLFRLCLEHEERKRNEGKVDKVIKRKILGKIILFFLCLV